MKLVDRKTFLQMPSGTVFCKFPLKFQGDAKDYCLGISSPRVLCERTDIDFFSCGIGSMCGYTSDGNDVLLEMQDNIGKEYSLSQHCCRDGLYEDENVGFAVYSREDVQAMIEQLQEALKDGYGVEVLAWMPIPKYEQTKTK